MNPPEFPKAFLKHCPKVLEAKEWHERLGAGEVDPEDYAECAFHNAGAGKECENCNKFLTRPFQGHKVDEEFLPQIEEFCRKLDEYYAWCEEQEKQQLEVGAGI